MRLLAVTDFHNTYDKVEEILKRAGKLDGTLIAGDLTHFGPTEKASELLDLLPKPIIAVPGNCDKKDLVEFLQGKGVNLHQKKMMLGNITIVGIGGSNPTPFNSPFELQEHEIKSSLEELMIGVCSPVILLSHAPPKGAQDEVPGGIHVGSTAIADIAPRFSAIICGHIHEARGVCKLGDTVVVNPGPASIGNAAVLEIDDEGNIGVKLI
jgi:hypothetical protein